VTHIPRLQTLSASAANSESDRDRVEMCERCSDSRRLGYNRKIAAQVLEYKAPWDCKRLPMFTIKELRRVFVGQSSPDVLGEGERLGYDDISPPESLADNATDTESGEH